MRKFLVLGVTFIILVNIHGWATATTVVVDDALKTYMWGTLNTCAWAFTKAHKNAGTTWQGDNTPSQATCTTNGVSMAQSNPPDAIATHTAPKDQIHASADATCNPTPPNCLSFTLHNPVTVVSKPHSVAAGAYARAGTAAGNAISGGVLRGPTLSIPSKMNLSAGTDPYESVFALAITDQALNEWNSELAKLLAIGDFSSLPANMCMASPKDPAGTKTDCGKPENLQKIEFRPPHTTYFQLVVRLDVNGLVDVQNSGTGTIDPPITKQDFEVKSMPCAPPAKNRQKCFTANLKDKLTRVLSLELPMPGKSPRSFTIDVVHGIVPLPPFGEDDEDKR